ncbi:hypothetical protein B0A49_10079 [Cryomyces minteri]|uniref:Uncharacterized protein n=1 Tax=Cryomyces minteri TaxID=331657 RepID=A0A4U0WJW6_9PEZI|nr:hypothetical protein B0A49_10079 [Cryomyces minteri]
MSKTPYDNHRQIIANATVLYPHLDHRLFCIAMGRDNQGFFGILVGVGDKLLLEGPHVGSQEYAIKKLFEMTADKVAEKVAAKGFLPAAVPEEK